MSNILIMIVVIQVYTQVRTHWTVSLKWVHFTVYKLHPNKALKIKKSAF